MIAQAGTAVDRDSCVLAGLARSLFILGSLLSLGDGLTTWWVLSRLGYGVEGNPWMAAAMRSVGTGPVCAARVVVGVIAFWFLSRHIVGVVRQGDRRRRRLARWEGAELGIGDRTWRWWDRHSASIEFAVALVVTAMVVGNNLRAVATLAASA